MSDITPAPTPIETVAHQAAFEVAIAAAEAAIIAQLPALALPVIKQAFGLIFHGIASAIYHQLSLIIAFDVIDNQIGNENADVKKTTQALERAVTSGDPNAIATAKTDFKKALGNLIHWDGNRPT